MDMDCNLKKIGPTFSSFNVIPEKTTEKTIIVKYSLIK